MSVEPFFGIEQPGFLGFVVFVQTLGFVALIVQRPPTWEAPARGKWLRPANFSGFEKVIGSSCGGKPIRGKSIPVVCRLELLKSGHFTMLPELNISF